LAGRRLARAALAIGPPIAAYGFPRLDGPGFRRAFADRSLKRQELGRGLRAKASPRLRLPTTCTPSAPVFETQSPRPIRQEPRFQAIVKDVEAKYQAEHERVGKWLQEQGLM